jgi:glutathione S-transferase
MPCIIKKGESTSNPMSIMSLISEACYIEDVMVGPADSTMRDEISQLVEMAARLSPTELTDYLNDHMKMRMFVVGKAVSVADICLFSAMVQYWRGLDWEAKMAKANTFRWIDHIQHLPGMWDQVQAR